MHVYICNYFSFRYGNEMNYDVLNKLLENAVGREREREKGFFRKMLEMPEFDKQNTHSQREVCRGGIYVAGCCRCCLC